MLRCAARISSGSAWAIAFSAASRSPRLIASSTVRTAPRIWVRRDLLITVRRAILRVAFLAELVLAMVSNFLRRRLAAGQGWLGPPPQSRDAAVWFGSVPEDAISGAKISSGRRRSKNSGGGIAPAA